MSADEEPHDPLPAILASLDQMAQTMPLLAKGSKAIYDSYLEVGFDEEQAFEVVLTYIHNWLD